jgi:hypothetical protein
MRFQVNVKFSARMESVTSPFPTPENVFDDEHEYVEETHKWA